MGATPHTPRTEHTAPSASSESAAASSRRSPVRAWTRWLVRRVLLALATAVALAHILSLSIFERADLQASHTLGGLTAVLIVVALSSPKATAWTDR